MKKTARSMAIVLGMSLGFIGVSEAKTVRATDLTASVWSQIRASTQDELVIEFRQGDELPVSLMAEGDLIETIKPATSYVGVKKDFWLKMKNNDVQISFDGQNFSAIKDALTGSIEAGAGTGVSGGIANAINVAFKAHVK